MLGLRRLGSCGRSASPVYVQLTSCRKRARQLARAILVTDSEELADQVEAELDRQLKELPAGEIARASIENNGRIILAPSKEAMFELMNQVAPEHLEIAMDDAYSYLDQVEKLVLSFWGTIPASRLVTTMREPITFCRLPAPAAFHQLWEYMTSSSASSTPSTAVLL